MLEPDPKKNYYILKNYLTNIILKVENSFDLWTFLHYLQDFYCLLYQYYSEHSYQSHISIYWAFETSLNRTKSKYLSEEL